jgi:hypothetical protein
LQEEKRTLQEYTKNKLGISVSELSEKYGIKISTLYARWRTKKGRVDIRNACFYLAATKKQREKFDVK